MINQVTLLGRCVKDAEGLASKTNEKIIVKFTLAINERNNKGEENVHYIPCTMFAPSDKIVSYLKKGTKIAVSGMLKQNNWTDKEGKKHTNLYVEVRYLEFGESAKVETPKNDFPF